MKFYTRKRRPPVVNIVSLIDILAILLIFFIVTTTFKKQQPQLLISLPKSSTATQAPAETEPALLNVESREKITLDEVPVTLEALEAALRELRETQPSRPLGLSMDASAPFQLVVDVLDALKKAGIENIPAFTNPSE